MLRPFFSYYGGKWRDAPKHYAPPAHDLIIEPFAGSAGYSLRHPYRDVLLVDSDPTVIGIWRWLIGADPDEVRALPDIEPGMTLDDIDAPSDAVNLIGFWLNKGSSTPKRTPSAWMRSGIRPGSFWGARVREVIASQLPAIRHWQAECGSYWMAPDIEATWFIDPPYQHAGKHYRHGSAGIDYTALAAWCRDRLGQVIVCEGTGADWLPFAQIADIKTTRMQRSNELAWTAWRYPEA